MNMNPMTILQMMKGGGNPKSFLMNMIKNQMGNNPMINNLMDMAQKGDKSGVEEVARNLCKERGVNFDTAFNDFMKQANNN